MLTWPVTKPKDDGTCSVIGIDTGPNIPIWWTQTKGDISRLENGDTIVLKIKGGSSWAGRGEMKYYGGFFLVLRILEIKANWGDYENVFICERLIDIPLRKKD